MSTTTSEEPRSRAALRLARRVLVKVGTSVVANEDGSPSLTRLGAIVEQISELHEAGLQVIFVSSGAVGMGKNLLTKQARLGMSFMDIQHRDSDTNLANAVQDSISNPPHSNGTSPSPTITDLLEVNEHVETSQAKSFAAAGQFEMMNLYQVRIMNMKRQNEVKRQSYLPCLPPDSLTHSLTHPHPFFP